MKLANPTVSGLEGFSSPLRNAFIGLLLLLCCSALADTVSSPLQPHTVMVDDHPLRVWQKAAAAPQAIVLLVHGRTWSTRPDFDLQVAGEDKSLMDGLVARGMTVYGVDLRGYGESPRDDSGWLTPDRAVRDVAAVLAWIHQRHSQKPYLFGWSYGSMVSQLVAQRSPDLVSGIILFGYPVREGSAITPPGSAGDPPRRATTASAAAEDFIVDGAISERAIAAFVAQALAADPVRADWRALEQWQALDAAAVTVPVLLMEGESDPLAVDDVQAELFNNLATTDKMWVVIPAGDHAAFLETPRDYFLSILQSFILRR